MKQTPNNDYLQSLGEVAEEICLIKMLTQSVGFSLDASEFMLASPYFHFLFRSLETALEVAPLMLNLAWGGCAAPGLCCRDLVWGRGKGQHRE